jgi:hypothetical protein
MSNIIGKTNVPEANKKNQKLLRNHIIPMLGEKGNTCHAVTSKPFLHV